MQISSFFLIKKMLLLSILLTACSSSESTKDKIENKPKVVTIQPQFHLPKLPKVVTFCGETFSIDDFDLKERLDKEIIVNAYYHSSTIQSLKRANRYFPIIEEKLKENGIPDDFKYLCLIESGLTQATSPAGAKGFWQFMPETAKDFGLKVNHQIDERLDIFKSTSAACQYLKNANSKFNDWMLSAASYNRGIGGIEKELKEQHVKKYFDLYLNNETSRYVFRILAIKLIFENPEAYGFSKKEIELYEPIASKKITVTSSIKNLKTWAKEKGTNYKMVKILNPWILGDNLKVKGETLIIEIPK